MSDQIRSFGSSPPAILSEDEILDYLAIHALYPVMSRKGKVYLRPANRKSLPNDAVGEILSRLAIHREEDCRALRRSVKERRAELRETRPIKKWVREERPRERLIQQGPASLPDSSLIAIIIGTGREGTSAEELGKRLINRLGSLRAVDSADVSDLCAIQGIGPAKAVQIKAALELGKRFCQENARRVQRIGKPDDIIEYVADYYGPYLRDAKKEVFLIILMDIKNKPLRHIEISRGSISASIVDPAEIVREATRHSASAVILVHNHPSGETEPSSEDIRVTQRISDACGLVDIKVIDHVIIGKNIEDYYSFARGGLIR